MKFWLNSPLMDQAGDDGAGGGGGGFDPVKFKTEMLAEFNKGLNGALKNLKAELTKKPDPDPTKPDPDPDPDPDPGSKTDPKVKGLEKRLADITAKLESEQKRREDTERKAEEKERHSLIRTALSKFQFAKETGLEAAFKLLADEIRRGEDGSLETPDGTSISEYLSTKLTSEYDYLLAPKPTGGAGAGNGTRRGTQTVDLNDIKPDMKAEDKDAARAEIARLLSERQ